MSQPSPHKFPDRRSSATSTQPVIITGASSGIGRATARRLVAAGVPVFGTVRSKSDATAFVRELGPLARALIFDLRDHRAIAAAADTVRTAARGQGVRALINNASGVLAGPLEHLPLSEFQALVDAGVTGVLAVTQAFLPLLREARASGHSPRIINVSSLFGEVVAPFLAPYSVVKFALEALSDGLRRELAGQGIRVVVVQPSAVGSRFWRRPLSEDVTRYGQTAYADQLAAFHEMFSTEIRKSVDVDRVAGLLFRTVELGRPKRRYRISAQPTSHALLRMLPATLVDRIFARSLKPRVDRSRLRPVAPSGLPPGV